MRYTLLYANKAFGQLGRIPAELTPAVEGHLLRLADSPTAASVPIASPPFPPRGQLFHFTVDAGTSTWFFTVIFQFSQNETVLHVLSVTWREVDD